MNIYKEGINNFLWKTLLQFQNEPFYKNYHLVGGTALTLLIGHRISDDIDLFTTEKIEKEKIFKYAQNIHKDVEIINDDKTIYQLYFPHKNLKIDFVQYPYKLLDPIITTNEGLHIVGKNDISAMKMSAVGTRGYEAKDFVDLYFLLKEMSIDNIIENFKIKYETENPLHYIRSLTYFDDVTSNSWKNIKFISEPISANLIKNTLIRSVRDYEKKLLNKNNQYNYNLQNNQNKLELNNDKSQEEYNPNSAIELKVALIKQNFKVYSIEIEKEHDNLQSKNKNDISYSINRIIYNDAVNLLEKVTSAPTDENILALHKSFHINTNYSYINNVSQCCFKKSRLQIYDTIEKLYADTLKNKYPHLDTVQNNSNFQQDGGNNGGGRK